MVISYEIYETSLWLVSYEMTTSLRFCLSYDPLKRNFIAFKMIIISRWKRIVGTDIVNEITHTLQSVITRVVIDMALSTE